ncbi:MAG: DUF1837 domain-containing protein [Gammaproteobacteria bacterium]|nr:DUF1837 domain-containing protein [Gammaproteobacteria bacterium]
MRKKLRDLLNKTLVLKYKLPCASNGIDGINISTNEDDAYICYSEKALSTIIYNSIIDYSFNEFEISSQEYQSLLVRALQTKLKYKPSDNQDAKIKYGFYGEVLLHSILFNFYNTEPIISRGYFYNPLENSETKGYDSYHIIENNKSVELWFGEVKFRNSLASCAKSAIDGLDKVLSDEYLDTNIIAMVNHRNEIPKGSKVTEILDEWINNPQIKILDEIKKHNMKLVYPILLVYPAYNIPYKDSIIKTIEHINSRYSKTSYKLSIEVELFFILVPIKETKKIKEDVISWIESKRPLLS